MVVKRSPLGRGKALARGGPLERRSPLIAQRGIDRSSRVRAVSKKREDENAVRRAVVAELLAAYPECQARWKCAGDPATEVHERLSRARGGSITDLEQSHAIGCCRACHAWLTEHPADATYRRLLLSQWHRCAPGGIGPC